MAPISDHQDDMDEIFGDGVVEDVLSGRPITDERAGEVGAVVADLRLLAAPPASEVANRHLAAMMAAATAMGPRTAPRRARRARRRLSPRWAASFGLAGVLSLTGGLAAAGALPAPAQHAVSRVAHDLGINLPTGDASPEPAISSTTTTAPTAEKPGGAPRSNSGSGGPKVTVSTSGHQSGRHGGGHDSGDDGNHTQTTGNETDNTQPDISGHDTHHGGGSTTPTTDHASTTPTTDHTSTTQGGGGGGGGGGGK